MVESCTYGHVRQLGFLLICRGDLIEPRDLILRHAHAPSHRPLFLFIVHLFIQLERARAVAVERVEMWLGEIDIITCPVGSHSHDRHNFGLQAKRFGSVP